MEENEIQINDGIVINAYVGVKNVMYMKKIWNPALCNCEYGKYLASIMDDSAIICDEVRDADVDADMEVERLS